MLPLFTLCYMPLFIKIKAIYKCPLTKLLSQSYLFSTSSHQKTVECRACQLKLSINTYTNLKVTQYYLLTLLTKSKVKSMNFSMWLITAFLSINMVYFPLKHILTKVAYEFVLWFSNSFRDISKEIAGLWWSKDMYKFVLSALFLMFKTGNNSNVDEW